MRLAAALLAALIGGSVARVTAADPAVVDLGGVRRAKAEIVRADEGWTVTLRMTPVRCFSAATNDALNREKARLFALQAFAKHKGGDFPDGVLVRGVQVVSAKADGDVYALTVRVPADGVESVPKPRKGKGAGERKPPAGERAAFTSALFTRTGEFAQTLGHLDQLLRERLITAEQGKDSAVEVEKIGAEGLSAYKSLVGEVDADRLLLTVEKEEMRASIQERVKEWTTQVDRAGRFAGVEIDLPFRLYLTADVLLMETAGAKVVDLEGGRRVVLAVASTALKDGSAEDRLRAERVCRVKALASVVAEREGVQVARTESAKDRTVVVIDMKGERASSVSEYLQVTTAEVKGVSKDMPVVGRWRSRDGATFYLALGVILDKQAQPVR